ncbi:MAG: portal protein [Gemmatimonadetes bacterium]|nr:MAG: portal protein [Gemmatimonadota bacterium]
MTTLDLLSTPTPRTSGRVERFGTIVVGGGQAGLSVGYHLQQRDLDFVIVDAHRRVGDVWRNRWDSLRLFTPAKYSGLPGMPFPAPPMHLPDKDEVADYLERYAERFDLPVRSGTRAVSLAHDGERWILHADHGTLEADNVVVATGPFQRPNVPAIAARLDESIHQLHSRDYRSPFDLPDGPVLVVGAGNSGAQIALELARHRKVWLAGRDTGHLPRRLLGRDIFDWLWPLMHRFTLETRLGRRLRRRVRGGGDALIGIPERALVDAGVVRVGRVEQERDGWPVVDGHVLRPSAIVWCTGFVSDYSWIDAPVFDERGVPRHTRGVVAEAPGLYFLGLRFQHRMNSSLVGGVGYDAAFVADEVVRRSETVMAE